METLLVILVMLGFTAATWYFLRDPSAKEKITDAVEDATEFVEEVTEAVEKVTKARLPTNKAMEKLTKAQLEELARDHGVELDRRKTKANMIKEFRAEYKKL